MPVTIPISDAYIDGLAPLYEPGAISLTQQVVEQIMRRDFPAVAALGIECYCERLLQVSYADGTQVFYLDWQADAPGYVLALIEPWTSGVGLDGSMRMHLRHYSGPEAAKRAEQVRRRAKPILIA